MAADDFNSYEMTTLFEDVSSPYLEHLLARQAAGKLDAEDEGSLRMLAALHDKLGAGRQDNLTVDELEYMRDTVQGFPSRMARKIELKLERLGAPSRHPQANPDADLKQRLMPPRA